MCIHTHEREREEKVKGSVDNVDDNDESWMNVIG